MKMWNYISCAAMVLVGCATEEVVQPVIPMNPVQDPPQQSVLPVVQPQLEPSSLVQTQQVEQIEPVYVPQVNTLSTANPVAKVNHAVYKQVILDNIHAESVVVEDVRQSRTNDGYKRIQVLVKNVTDTPIRTRYRFDWQDANGVVILDPDHNGWEKLTLLPGDDGVFTSIAPKKECSDFRLRMKGIQ